jgi:hypothetical protein
MSNTGVNGFPVRPLLTNGEKLREAITIGPTGGGPKTYPVSLADSVANLATFTESAIRESAALPAEYRGARLVVEATLRPEFLANSYFPAELLKTIKAEPIGSRFSTAVRHATGRTPQEDNARTKTLFLSADDNSLHRLNALLQNPNAVGITDKVRHALQAIDRIEVSKARQVLPETVESDRAVLESVLHPESDGYGHAVSASQLTLERWESLIDSLGGEIEDSWIRRSGQFTYIPVTLPVEAVSQAREFNSLRIISPMPHARRVEEIRELPVPRALTEPTSPPEALRPLRVAVFDGGVDSNSPYWAGRVTERTLGSILPDSQADDHGALVTSALLYGADPQEPLEPANMAIDHFRVWPQVGQDDYEMYWLLDEIKAAVEHADYQVVIIATAPQKFIEEDYVDRWTHELDQLSHDRNVLFVTAAGNNGEQRAQSGQNRILLPSDMVNGMAIGASTTRRPKPDRASYSAIGPGRPGGRVRPDGLAFGGTDASPFYFLRNDGTVAATVGTSAAAPNFVHGIADLATRIGPTRVSPVSLRAFAAHFALPAASGLSAGQVGHGALRESWEFVNDDRSHVAHVLYEDVISRDESIPLLIPMPDGAGRNRIKLTYTLVTSTAVDAKDPVEYTKAGLTIRLRPDSEKFAFSKRGETARTLHLRRDAAEIARLSTLGFTPAADPVTISLNYRGKDESKLREEGKWDTLRSFTRSFQAGNLFRPRVEISYLAREEGLLLNDAPPLSWALLVTLEGPGGSNLHDEVRAQFPVLTPLTVAVPGASVTTGNP